MAVLHFFLVDESALHIDHDIKCTTTVTFYVAQTKESFRKDFSKPFPKLINWR